MKLQKSVLFLFICILCLAMAVPALAAEAFECGPTAWLSGNRTNYRIPGTTSPTVDYSESLNVYVGGRAKFKSTGTVSKRSISVTVKLYDNTRGYYLGSATKTQSVQYSGSMPETSYYSWKSSNRIETLFAAGDECYYKVTCSNYPSVLKGRYCGFLSN